MPPEVVDQIGRDGALVQAPDCRLTEAEKNLQIQRYLPGATVTDVAGVRAMEWQGRLLLKKQVTHLGRPWPAHKKRIQIPKSWLGAEAAARQRGTDLRFLGIYYYDGVTIFVDFDPVTYVRRKANNSAAHVSTNDLFQAYEHGIFERTDSNGNRLTSVRGDELAAYLKGANAYVDPRVEAFQRCNVEFFTGQRIEALDAVQEMHAAGWPDTFQGEWPGFYLEYSVDEAMRRLGLDDRVRFQRIKSKGSFDYDLELLNQGSLEFYGDLKASDVTKNESPGNDAADLRRCLQQYGRFWYVVYEHETWKAAANGHVATRAWNNWKRYVGHVKKSGEFNELSYHSRFKEAVRYVRMFILEVNPANVDLALGEFKQGRQPSGAERAIKVMIKKKNIDNFLIYSEDIT